MPADRCHLPLRMCMSSHRLSMLVVASEAGTCKVTKSDPLSSSFRVSTGALFPIGICAHTVADEDVFQHMPVTW